MKHARRLKTTERHSAINCKCRQHMKKTVEIWRHHSNCKEKETENYEKKNLTEPAAICRGPGAG